MVISRRATFRRSGMSLLGVSALAISLAACAPSSPSGSATGEGELTKISVGVIPVADIAPIYLGIEQGFFEDAGLELDLQMAQGGAAIIPAVVSGDYQVGFSNIASVMIAADKGLPIQVVSNGSSSTGVPFKDAVEVAAAGSSAISNPLDLQGKRVAINALNNFGDIAIKNSVEKAGGDPSTIDFVEVPYPNMPAQLAAGEIDAAWTAEPFRTQILSEGGKIVASPLSDMSPGIDEAYYFTSKKIIAEKPELVASFVKAIEKSFDYATKNEQETRAVLEKDLGLKPELAANVVLTEWPNKINLEGFRAMGEASAKYGVIKSVPNPADVIYSAK